jgi:hypothetical protein
MRYIIQTQNWLSYILGDFFKNSFGHPGSDEPAGTFRFESLLLTDVNTWDRCYDFKNIFAEKISEKIGVF